MLILIGKVFLFCFFKEIVEVGHGVPLKKQPQILRKKLVKLDGENQLMLIGLDSPSFRPGSSMSCETLISGQTGMAITPIQRLYHSSGDATGTETA